MKRATTAGKSGPTAGPTAGKNLIRKDGCGKQTAGSEEVHDNDDSPNASQRQAQMLQTSAVQRMTGGRIRDHRAAVLHDTEGPKKVRSEFHRCRLSARWFTVSAEVAGGSTGQSIDRDVGAHAVRQRQVLAGQAAQITGEVKIHHVEQGCEEPHDANLQREKRHAIAISSRRQWTRQVSRECSHRVIIHMQVPLS